MSPATLERSDEDSRAMPMLPPSVDAFESSWPMRRRCSSASGGVRVVTVSLMASLDIDTPCVIDTDKFVYEVIAFGKLASPDAFPLAGYRQRSRVKALCVSVLRVTSASANNS